MSSIVPGRGGTQPGARTPLGRVPLLVGMAIVLLLAVVGGGLLLLGGGGPAQDPTSASTVDETTPNEPTAGATSDDAGTEESSDETSAPPSPPAPEPLAPADLRVPGTADRSTDNDGNPVTYEANNLLDDDPRTAWRVAGDATGEVLTFRFDEQVTLTEVGVINGYAKHDPPHDWYPANRRVAAVEWDLGGGTTVPQDLSEDRDLQVTTVDPVETDVVELRLVEVSPPGSRDYTALSEVVLVGARS